VDYYRFTIDPGAIEAHFETFSTSGNVDLYIKPGCRCPRHCSGFRLRQHQFVPDQRIHRGDYQQRAGAVDAGRLVPGRLYARNGDVPYSVRVIEVLTNNIVTLTNAVPYNASGTAFPVPQIDYYLFTVSTLPCGPQFEVQSPSEDVSLIVKKDLPLPTMANADYSSTNSGTGDELITVFNTSTPPLSPGDWYIGVVVRTSLNPVTYTVTATEYTNSGNNLIITGFSIVALRSASPGQCLAWRALLRPGQSRSD